MKIRNSSFFSNGKEENGKFPMSLSYQEFILAPAEVILLPPANRTLRDAKTQSRRDPRAGHCQMGKGKEKGNVMKKKKRI